MFDAPRQPDEEGVYGLDVPDGPYGSEKCTCVPRTSSNRLEEQML